MGRTPRTAAKSGTRHAILTSLDADAVTFASAIPLFIFAIGPVKGFALTLMIGIVCDLTIAHAVHAADGDPARPSRWWPRRPPSSA